MNPTPPPDPQAEAGGTIATEPPVSHPFTSLLDLPDEL